MIKRRVDITDLEIVQIQNYKDKEEWLGQKCE
jgi:hypothetical protein